MTNLMKKIKEEHKLGNLVPLIFLNIMIIISIIKGLVLDMNEEQIHYNIIILSIFFTGYLLFTKLKQIEKRIIEGEENEVK